jgi:hypothetical protein
MEWRYCCVMKRILMRRGALTHGRSWMRLWPTLHQTSLHSYSLLIGLADNYLDFREDYVDRVEILLRHEEDTHEEGSPLLMGNHG